MNGIQSTANLDQFSTGQLLMTAARLVEEARNQQLRAAGLTHSGLKTLQALAKHGPTTQGQLARLLRLRNVTLDRILEKLDARSWIGFQQGAMHSRLRRVSINDGGRAVLERADDLQRACTRAEGHDAHELRSPLCEVILELGPASWKRTTRS